VDSNRKVLWIIIGGVICAWVAAFAVVVLWRDSNSGFTALPPTTTAFPEKKDRSDKNDNPPVAQNLAITPNESPPQRGQNLLSAPQGTPPAVDEATQEKMIAFLNTGIRDQTRNLFAGVFQQLGLSSDVQDKVIDILTQQDKQLQQQALDAEKSGTIPTPLSIEKLQAQQVEQDQQLRGLLGDAGFTKFTQYRMTMPDRMIINSMNQDGANLTETQSQQLLEVLTQARQQIVGQSGVTSNLNPMSPDHAIATIQQQQTLLQQTINNRVQNILTAQQTALLQHALSQRAIGPTNQ
jgi:hypothetical protein